MNRESALLGTPTFTVFAGRLGAADAQLIRDGLMYDLRDPAAQPRFVKKAAGYRSVPTKRRNAILRLVTATIEELRR
jgi:predicted glycosyltransferase